MQRSLRLATALALGTVVLLSAGAWIYASRAMPAAAPQSLAARAAVHSHNDSRDRAKAVGDDRGWPCLLGPDGNSMSAEVASAAAWPAAGPPVRWRTPVGEGYSSPVALGEDVIVFHRPKIETEAPGEAEQHGPDEVITCFDLSKGQPRWHFRHPTGFHCKTHYSSGPYSTPVIDSEHVYAFGTEGNLYCLNRSDGALIWQRELWHEFAIEQAGYFPPAGSPLLVGDRLILNLGATEAAAGIIAMDKDDGRTLWTATKHGASYATPCAATIHGREFVFVFTAEGLVALD